MKINRIIAIIITVSFAVFLGHNLIPHHHHCEVVSMPVSSQCPVDHSDHHGDSHDADHNTDCNTEHSGEEHPIHCHAFNDVVFDKYTPSDIQPRVRVVQEILHAETIYAIEASVIDGSARSLCFIIPDLSFQLVGGRSLRGPPTA